MNGWIIAILVGFMLILGCAGGSGEAGETSAEDSNADGGLDKALDQLSGESSEAAVELPGVGEDTEGSVPEVDYLECVDTDGGDDKYTYGQIKRITHYTDGTMKEEVIAEDKCVGSNIVQEYLCREESSGEYRKMEWTCLNCEDGACTR